MTENFSIKIFYITPKARLITENIIIFLLETLPAATSLLFVRLTKISSFLSFISFQIHPKERIPQEPKKNIMQR